MSIVKATFHHGKQVENREVFKALMAKYGFLSLAHEWWHYDYWNWKACDVIMLDFNEIEKVLASQ